MVKDCTSIDQGRELIELGIDPSTADKCWISIDADEAEPAIYPMSWEQAKENCMSADKFLTDTAREYCPKAMTPGWSLTALLEQLPSDIENNGKIYSFRMIKVGEEYQIAYTDSDSHDLYSILEDTPVNTAFRMLCLLYEIKQYS